MGNASPILEQANVVLAVECDEPNGKVVRTVRPCRLTVEKFNFFYNKISQFKTLLNEDIDTFEKFVARFMYQDEAGQLYPKGLIWEVDDVGLLFLTEIKPLFEAQAHFVFWDKRFRGRKRLILEMLAYVFHEYKFHRIVVEVPLYAKKTMNAVEAVGFVKEGRKREAVRHDGMWFDVNLYSILESEVWGQGSKQ